jgi:hypothetical protein
MLTVHLFIQKKLEERVLLALSLPFSKFPFQQKKVPTTNYIAQAKII